MPRQRPWISRLRGMLPKMHLRRWRVSSFSCHERRAQRIHYLGTGRSPYARWLLSEPESYAWQAAELVGTLRPPRRSVGRVLVARTHNEASCVNNGVAQSQNQKIHHHHHHHHHRRRHYYRQTSLVARTGPPTRSAHRQEKCPVGASSRLYRGR